MDCNFATDRLLEKSCAAFVVASNRGFCEIGLNFSWSSLPKIPLCVLYIQFFMLSQMHIICFHLIVFSGNYKLSVLRAQLMNYSNHENAI
jgi:hypothetical protein